MEEDLEYFYVSNAHVSNFVSVKLSGNGNYHMWKTQMLCLMESYNMQGILDGKCSPSKTLSPEMEKRYQSLVKGWIFGSISEELFDTVVDLGTPKAIWDKLKSLYDPTMMRSQQVHTETEVNHTLSTETEIEDMDAAQTNTTANDMDATQTETITNDRGATPTKDIDASLPTTIQIKGEESNAVNKDKIIRNKKLCKAILERDWWPVQGILDRDRNAATEAINSDGNTVLHLAVGLDANTIVLYTLSYIQDEQLPYIINLDGSTALHVAAIVGNTEAAVRLIKRNRKLLDIQDHKGETPLDKAYENMHFDTLEYMLKAVNETYTSPLEASVNRGIKGGSNLLVNAISANQYDLATDLVKKFPEIAVENDSGLMALARTFPSGLDYGETLLYPRFSSMEDFCEGIVGITKVLFDASSYLYVILEYVWRHHIRVTRGMLGNWRRRIIVIRETMLIVLLSMLYVPFAMLFWIFVIIYFLIIVVCHLSSMFYFLSWKVSARLVAPFRYIENKKRKWVDANEFLELLCDEIEKVEFPDAHFRYYSGPILEAARQNVYDVVDEILKRSPEAVRYKDKNGHDIIQLAVIHRSEKIYNLVYVLGERKSVYRTIEDSSKNNMLHLAGRLAPSQKLKSRTGAAFQLQTELQWREEVKKLVFPAYITKENNLMETPDMVFTKEHENLVKEGEKWMKAVAESCSITAALITTIVFAAAITVPGGSNQETGIPLFTKDIAFTIFAVSDAISLFASSTALLMFLSILTGRFAEQDFLVILPRRLIIGLCTLMLSTTAMMVAFGATLFLVFCHRKPWMLAPICILAFLPIVSFGTLQIPLIVDLFRSTYVRIFGKPTGYNSNRFNPNDIKLYFGK